MNNHIKSKLITLEEIVKEGYRFNIPIYQRLYVWGDDQIKTLLEDLKTAFENQEAIFYLGGVLVQETHTKHYDLIDGQQRFTTLWLLSLVLKEHLADFVKVGEDLRMSFSIRKEVTDFFAKYPQESHQEVKFPTIVYALKYMSETFKPALKGKKEGAEEATATENIKNFTDFVRTKVKFVFTEVPQNTDLNKLFEIINNRGIQLQHHEILKARLLDKLPENERLSYSRMWDACAYMDNYVEKNIKDTANITIGALFDNDSYEQGTEELANPDTVYQKTTVENQENAGFSKSNLQAILSQGGIEPEDKDKTKNKNNKENEVRSIISFPMLLLHTLRIYLHQKDKGDIKRILDKELLKIFQEYKKETWFDAKEFLNLLWSVRYVFDKYIIKWVRREGEDEHHQIIKLYKQEDKYVVRQWDIIGNREEELLQSMLYHSQQITTHYWLTPLLHYLLKSGGKDSYQYLKHLDNHLFCSNEGGSLVERTHKFLQDFWRKPDISLAPLHEKSGIDFSHYWFYKLEFVLFVSRNNDKIKISEQRKKLWDKFRITARNSVEHISPQKQQDTDTNTVSKEILDTFGNLALVTRSINSSYSNLPFNEKRQRFINNNKDKVDSLKMDIIYQNTEWNDKLAQAHQEKMIEVLTDYIKSTNS